MKIPRRQPRSLSRYAVREKVKLALAPRSQRLLRQSSATLRLLFLGEIASLFTLGALSLGVAFLPWGVSLRPLRDEETARTYLQVLWQVEAAILALSLAVIIFVFQAVCASRLRGSLRSFAEAVGLFPIIYVGVNGLALTGMVLLGGGRAAPGGWAATWAIVWAAATLALLASLFVRTLRAMRAVRDRRRRDPRPLEDGLEHVRPPQQRPGHDPILERDRPDRRPARTVRPRLVRLPPVHLADSNDWWERRWR